jgi:hypothetical protein
VEFLEDSELLLRNVMKISADSIDDLREVRKTANAHLAGIEQRKEAASEALPVVNVMETYETLLRDIRNIDSQTAAEDITDIQHRIRKNALIANLKAFQPAVSLAGFQRH